MSETAVRTFLGAVLAGGQSTRFGRPKWSEPLAGVPMALRAAAALAPHARAIVAVAPASAPAALGLGLEAVADAPGGRGPLGGIVAALERAAAAGDAGCLVAGCDFPLIDPGLIGALIGAWAGEDVVAPIDGGRVQPLCALWSVAALPAARAALVAGRGSPTRLAERLVLRAVSEPEWRPAAASPEALLNVNTPAEFARAAALVGQGGAPGAAPGS